MNSGDRYITIAAVTLKGYFSKDAVNLFLLLFQLENQEQKETVVYGHLA